MPKRNIQTLVPISSIVGIVMLTLITAGAHIYLGTQQDEALRVWFLLNGLGFLSLLVLYFLPFLRSFRRSISWVHLGYVVLTIVLWLFLGSLREGTLDPFDAVVKAVEITLAVQLIFHLRTTRPIRASK